MPSVYTKAFGETVNIGTYAPSAGIKDIGTLVNVIVKNAFTLGGVIVLVLLILGGFGFIMSAGSGDVKGMEKGKKAITAAVAGLILIFMSVAIIQIISILTGYQLLGTSPK
jgi:hypothetical protein